MNLRSSTEEDLPAIIELLKASLGESLIPKSMELWKWKHITNPHGISPVLVAEEKGEIIGVRAFMKWNWSYKGDIIKSVRAVDTATHPNHQGKGIFKKLTLAGVENVKSEGVGFIFNTPNESSKPGYLKMGWVEKGRMPLKLKVNPLAFKSFNEPDFTALNWNDLISTLPKFKNPIDSDNQLQTLLSAEYIKWRYKDNPLFNYEFITDYQTYVLFYRIKKHSFGLEMRIVDVFIDTNKFNSLSRKTLVESFNHISKSTFLVSASGRHYTLAKGVYPKLGMLPILEKGPLITLRNILMEQSSFDELKDEINWGYSLGDMELF